MTIPESHDDQWPTRHRKQGAQGPSSRSSGSDLYNIDRSRIVPRDDWRTVPSDAELISEAQRVFTEDCLRALRLVAYGLLPLAALLFWAVWNRGPLVITSTLPFLAAAGVLGAASILKTAARPLFKSDRFLAGCSTAMTCGGIGIVSLSWVPVKVGPPGLLIMLVYGPLVGSVLWHAAAPVIVFNALKRLPSSPLPEAERYALHSFLLDAESVGHGLDHSFAELAKSTVTMGYLRAAEAAQIVFLMFFLLHLCQGHSGSESADGRCPNRLARAGGTRPRSSRAPWAAGVRLASLSD